MRPTVAFLFAASLGVAACGQRVLVPSLLARDQAPPVAGRDPLKVHMNSGELYMLRSWSVDTSARELKGVGTHYTIRRDSSDAPAASIPFDSIALLEASRHQTAVTFGTVGVGIFTGVGAYVSLVCLADPKSCFGSCPTFYIEGDDPTRVQAEGFSASVARVLAARDVDALPRPAVRGNRIALHMRNEAWETHVVQSVNLLVAPRPPDGRVFHGADSAFYPATNIRTPVTCDASEGGCLTQVARLDGDERSSLADSLDLAKREYIELEFENTPQRPGLVLSARNSLITTFLFYESMSVVGRNVGAVAAAMERNGRDYAESQFGMAKLLGPIEVQLLTEGVWRTVGEFGEPGPIAADTKVVPLPRDLPAGDVLRVRLRLTKGNWRVDWVALASLGDPVTPTRVGPKAVEQHGKSNPTALAWLRDDTRHLVSMPGDDYRLIFDLPANARDLELFLESEGYYYEWMREEWLAGENQAMAALVLLNPAEALRRLAPAYKAREREMDRLFWSSRFTRQTETSR